MTTKRRRSAMAVETRLSHVTNLLSFELIFAISGTIEHAINLYKSYKPPTCGSKMADYATSGINE